MPRLLEFGGRDLSDPHRPDRSRAAQVAPYVARSIWCLAACACRNRPKWCKARISIPSLRIVFKSWPKPSLNRRKPQRNQSHPMPIRAKPAPPAAARKALQKSPAKPAREAGAAAKPAASPRRGRESRQMGVHLRRRQGRRQSRTCAICWAARAPISPRWPISACRCLRASPFRPRSAPISTRTTNPIRRN